ncbi:LysM peptidoglycan-binding domain-containing protein [Peribacillus saganii]|uniref:LysM peptidoglycan-binding domain-containing protein n=1 Tax=Peribacillus saganii TaxID=2303992 RepID=A0A372LTS3_9BACI|nr:LysM peptidoglycan-binding domain-containing protein [Peribacillus saganii]RFU71578.1 LysM peptidoglycan-binding domain-containing protein [Peribacillus saganii]
MMAGKKPVLIILLLIVLLFAVSFYVYWFHFLLVKQNIETLKQTIASEEQLLAEMERQQTGNKGEILIQTTELQKKVPVSPLVDQFLLELERAEVASGSLITSISFSEGQAMTNETLQGEGQIPQQAGTEQTNPLTAGGAQNPGQEGNTGGTQQDQGETWENSEAAAPAVSLPEGIERITAAMTVESPTYFELESFIKEIQSLPRITMVDNLAFTGTNEVRQITDEVIDKLTYNVTISAFYYPNLEELRSQLPKLDVPAPGNKINPLAPSIVPNLKTEEGETTPSDGTAVNSDGEMVQGVNADSDENNGGTVTNGDMPTSWGQPKQVEKNNKKYNVYTYKVKKGDTMFSLSLKYYNSNKGIEIIKNWNGFTKLQAGMKIEIPIEADGEN